MVQAPVSEKVVVGVDGSEGSKSALAWAASQAKLMGVPLEVVWVWEVPASYGWSVAWPSVDLAADIEKALAEVVDEVLDAGVGIDVTTDVVEGHPAHVLAEKSKAATLLVVGSRGLGSFRGLLLGSISAHLATHAACTTVIVRPGQKATSAAA
jgi:nucleotide-binding universal stress UspA family protein